MHGLLLVHKPCGITSFQVVRRIRALTKVKRVGHAGTLDPFASGLLIVGVGREFTRQLDQFQALEKTYMVTVVFGIQTDTFDRDGQVTAYQPVNEFPAQLQAILPQFTGEQLQTPPMFSAKKINGKKLYDLARKGITVERKPCKVTISELSVVPGSESWISPRFSEKDFDRLPMCQLKIVCSKGTYIRSLVADIGKACGGVGAFALELVRERIGAFGLADALRYEDLSLEKICRIILPIRGDYPDKITSL